MKTKNQTQTRPGRVSRAGATLAGSMMVCCVPLVLGETPAAQQDTDTKNAAPDKKEAPATPESEALGPGDYTNWAEISVGGVFSEGDENRFQQRYHLPAGQAYGGLNDLHWEQDVGKSALFKIDGRALFEKKDYSVKLDLTNPDAGYVRAGYKQFRVWSDGVGGWNRQNDVWLPLDDRDLSLDRGEAFVEGGLTLPNWPVIKLRYSHLFRDGEKDSTIWGTASVPGGTRGLTGSFLDVDETRDIFQADASHTVGKTALGLGLRYELGNQIDSRNLHQSPNTGSETFVTSKDGVDTDLFNVHAFTQTRFNEQYMLSSGVAYTTLDTDLSGSRIYGSDYDAVYDPGLAVGTGYLNLAGGSRMNQYVLNLNLFAAPWDHFSFIPSVRVEKQDLDGQSSFLETPFNDLKAAENDRDFVDVSERLEARYDGVKNWLFYARGDWLQGDGDLKEKQIAAATGDVELNRDSDFTRFTQKYTAGVNWYPLQRLNLAGQYYHKIHNNNYDHERDSTPNGTGILQYPAFLTDQDFETDDVNFRVTWRPWTVLTLVSRYDYQLSTVDTRADTFSSIESAKLTRHIFSESATWQPWSRLYLQGNLNYVLNETTTPVSEGAGRGSLVQAAQNDYWTAMFSSGLALNQKTDLQAQYYYSRADNYVDNSSVSQPYGAGFEEHGVTASLTRTIGKGLRWMLRYGFFSYRDQATGGHTDFTSHLVYSSLLYRF
jgi:hypothetical protein